MGRSGAEWEFEVRAPKGDAPRSGPGTSVSPLTFATVPNLFFILETKTVMGDPPCVGRAKMLRPGPEPGSQEASARVRGDRPRLGFLEACALSPQGVIGASVALRPQSGGGGSGVVKSLRDPPPGPAGLPPGRARVLLPTMPPVAEAPPARPAVPLPVPTTPSRCQPPTPMRAAGPVPARSPSAVSVTRGPKPVSGKLQKQTIHRFSVTCF